MFNQIENIYIQTTDGRLFKAGHVTDLSMTQTIYEEPKFCCEFYGLHEMAKRNSLDAFEIDEEDFLSLLEETHEGNRMDSV